MFRDPTCRGLSGLMLQNKCEQIINGQKHTSALIVKPTNGNKPDLYQSARRQNPPDQNRLPEVLYGIWPE